MVIDVAPEAAITTHNVNRSIDSKRHIIAAIGSGVAIIDCDRDGETLEKSELTSHYLRRWHAVLFATIMSITARGGADNPIIQTNFTADPAPLVYKGTVYLYTSHDEDDATVFHMIRAC